MNRRTFLGLGVVFGGTFMSGLFATEPVNRTHPDTVAAGNTAFALDLYGRIRAEQGNVFCSPFSISAALAMTSAGARGETLAEMNKVLHLPGDGSSAPIQFADLILQLLRNDGKSKYELHIANALWVQNGFPIKPVFVDVVKTQYHAVMRQTDFGQPVDAVAAINRWVELKTNDKIKDLLKPDNVDSTTRLVLTNAIYFKGKWHKQFKKEMTREEPFFTTSGGSTKAPLMHQGGNYRHVATDGMQAVALPYEGDNLEMVLLLPDDKDGLGKLESNLSMERLDGLLKAMKRREGDVAIPRFKFTQKIELSKELQDLGMKLAFSNGADFSGMTSADRLKIDQVIHKAFVDVNEEGTEAAAATGVTMKLAAAPVPQDRFNFRADHPFLFAIRDVKSGSLLFLGRVNDPTKQ